MASWGPVRGGLPPSSSAANVASVSPPGGPQPDKPTICKYFINGGCLRGEDCQYLHELPDERHLDVNGLGFIFNSNVHNPQQQQQVGGVAGGKAAAMRKMTPPTKKPIPRYRPPEAHLEHNLPPSIAIAFETPTADVMGMLLRTMQHGA